MKNNFELELNSNMDIRYVREPYIVASKVLSSIYAYIKIVKPVQNSSLYFYDDKNIESTLIIKIKNANVVVLQ